MNVDEAVASYFVVVEYWVRFGATSDRTGNQRGIWRTKWCYE
jgi:hypothetical protein